MPTDQGTGLYAGGTCCERFLSGHRPLALYTLTVSDSTMPLASSLTHCLQIFSFISILCLHLKDPSLHSQLGSITLPLSSEAFSEKPVSLAFIPAD